MASKTSKLLQSSSKLLQGSKSASNNANSKEYQLSTCALRNSEWAPKPQTSSKVLQNSSKAPKALQRTLQK
jgi:hypothetical protein